MASPIVLKHIPKIKQLSPRIIQILGCNPGVKTLQGTNTYLIGTGKRRILLDTGEGKAEYLENLKQSLADCVVNDIIITHHHHDHVRGIPGVLSLMKGETIRTLKYPHISDNEFVKKHPLCTFTDIQDGDVFSTEGASIQSIFTPGHASDHVSFFMPEEKVLFSGDCILGEGTTGIEDLNDYLNSLTKFLKLDIDTIYPGHGSVITQPKTIITQYIKHRNMREKQILAVLQESNEAVAPKEIVMSVYKYMFQGLAENLIEAATANVESHLDKLKKESKVCKYGTL